MIELRLALSYGALRALCTGDELQFDIDEKLQVLLRLDDEGLELVRQQYEAYMLASVPTDPNIH